MSNHTNPPTQNQLQEQNEEYAIQEYLAGLDTPPQVTEIACTAEPTLAEPTLADIDPYENEQFEQEMRDTQMEKDSRWLARLIHFGIRKPR